MSQHKPNKKGAAKKRLPKFKFHNDEGRFYWLTSRQINNKLKKGFELTPTAQSVGIFEEKREKYSAEFLAETTFKKQVKAKGPKKTEKIKSTIADAIEGVEKKGRGRQTEFRKRDLSVIPLQVIPNLFADSEAQFNKLKSQGKILKYPSEKYKIIRVDKTVFETTNRIDFINELNNLVTELYDVIDLIAESEDANKISSPQFFAQGDAFLIKGGIISGMVLDLSKTELRGVPTELFSEYYSYYVKNIKE
jgi:hypothetical protein